MVILQLSDESAADLFAQAARASGLAPVRCDPTEIPWEVMRDAFLISDAPSGDLASWAAELRSRGTDPRGVIVRVVPTQPAGWVYHDLPVFASVTAPRSADEARALLERLRDARSGRSVSDAAAGALVRDAAGPTAYGASLTESVERLMRIAARSDVKVLLIGETGTGKGTMAKEIHRLSGRPGPFVTLDCAALPETLIESELFGVEAGAYTGATRSRSGKIELAHEGTLFLDEVDSIPLHLQSKLLGAIQDMGASRLGDHRFRKSDFRLIAATQQPLERLVAQRTFRADLLHRISVLQIHMPRVRDLGARLIAIFEGMVRVEADRIDLPPPPIPPALYAMLLSHSWPGNFRELSAVAQRLVLGVPLFNQGSGFDTAIGLRETLREVERTLITAALERHDGSTRRASLELRLPIETLRYRMRSLGLASPSVSGSADATPETSSPTRARAPRIPPALEQP